ncbi:MAG TPA: alanine--tRNA ligase [Candidatus Acidoferrales bacterium]|nr:alanine--tRNA ligase [Candidatus Acidoferrales bacterium]
MLNKDELRANFSKEPKKYYEVKTFKDEGFERRQCKGCSKYFWTVDSDRKFCGDSSHEPYTFMKPKMTNVTYADFWKRFSDFFKKEGHEIIEKYPVVSRWRQDLYFTIASIQDFQRLENGKINFEYNANPLLVPQICMRFNDIPNVGVTGRHFTAFMMPGQHAFNYPKEGYWRDRTIELNYNLLTSVLGVKKKDLTYVEDTWAMGDFSEFGPSLESFANGLELVNSVFTQFEYADGKVKELNAKVVDVGWGFERLMWFYSGAQTAYDVVFKNQLDYIYKTAGIKPDHKIYAKVAGALGTVDASEVTDVEAVEKRLIKSSGITEREYFETIKPMQAAYAIADHTRTLLFAISDGALPSNVGGGYNLRIILRRAFDFIDRYAPGIDVMKIMESHSSDLVKVYKDIQDSLDEISEVVDVEKKRYDNTKSSAMKIVNTIVEKKEKLTKERARTLYESHGITPDFIKSIAESKKVKLDVPEELYNEMIKGDFAGKKKEPKNMDIETEDLPKTEKLFYDNFATEAESKVLRTKGAFVILDKTPFYAESGGQEADRGTIEGNKVVDVQSINGVIVHVLEKSTAMKTGAKVKCAVDKERRLRLMAHHTATHLVSAAARSILGKHAWQEGAKKSPDKAHIDISHYERLTEKQVREIEARANSYITHGIKVSVDELGRNDAERKYGFSIYQGHGVPASKLRIVKVTDLKGKLIDAEACGGLHLATSESSIGIIKIVSASRIHDGINRLEFVAGPAAYEYINRMEDSINSIATAAGVDRDKLDAGMAAKLEELRIYRQKYESAEAELCGFLAEQISTSSKSKEAVKELEYDRKMLRKIATLFVEKNPDKAILIHNKELECVAISGEESTVDALELIKATAAKMKKKFNGGGSKRIAEGRIASQ